MENVVNTTLMRHLELHNLLSPHQFGFRKRRSAPDLLTSIGHDWRTCIEAGGTVRVLAVDVAGAFDKVSHLGVLHKLMAYGVNGSLHQWLSNYLSSRQLQAVVGGAVSAAFPISAGVPQGSILGPTLFLVYVNDAVEALPQSVTPATYADDTTLYSLIPSADAVLPRCTALQAGTDALSEWGSTWRVKFESSKSQAMSISRHHQQWPVAPLEFGGVFVEEVTSLKLLGVTFDNKLSFSYHLRSVALRAAQRIGFLRKACAILDRPGRLRAYKGFVRPIMEYSPLVWCSAPASYLGRLDKVQRRALALIGHGSYVDSLQLRRTVYGLCMLFKLVCHPRLPYLESLLPSPKVTTSARTRRQRRAANGHLHQLSNSLSSHSSTALRRTFPYFLLDTWNSLPESILPEKPLITHLQAFKTSAYLHLRRMDWNWATQTYP